MWLLFGAEFIRGHIYYRISRSGYLKSFLCFHPIQICSPESPNSVWDYRKIWIGIAPNNWDWAFNLLHGGVHQPHSKDNFSCEKKGVFKTRPIHMALIYYQKALCKDVRYIIWYTKCLHQFFIHVVKRKFVVALKEHMLLHSANYNFHKWILLDTSKETG